MALTKVDKTVIEATGTASATTFLRGDGSWASASAGFNSVQVFTSGGTWSKTTNNPTKIIVEVVGTGGGGCRNDTGGTTLCGGAGGGYAKKFLDVTNIDTATVAIGTVGARAGVGTNPEVGAAGGASSFIKLAGSGSFTDVIGNGGAGGNITDYVAATGGTATGGDINIQGGVGGTFSLSSKGGDTPLGFGGHNQYTGSSSDIDATGYGAGGGAGQSRDAGIASAGVVIVWEYK